VKRKTKVGRSGPNEPSVREPDFAFAMFYAKFAGKQPQNTQYLRIRNIEHVLTRTACYIMVCTDANSHTNGQELKSAWAIANGYVPAL
jgi:hypothetical protein